MTEHVAIIDPASGQLTIEGDWAPEALAQLDSLLGPRREVNCARPGVGGRATWSERPPEGMPHGPRPDLIGRRPPVACHSVPLRVHRIYHGSVVDGPGRRSVLQVQGCPIRCRGCYVPETHAMDAGDVMTCDGAIEALLDVSGHPRDGVTITGGEASMQAQALAPLVTILHELGIHICLYSGYTVERLVARSRQEPSLAALLADVDLLVAGPYIQQLTANAGEWMGSRNQRIVSNEEIKGGLGGKPLAS